MSDQNAADQNAADDVVSRSDKWINLLIAAAAIAGCIFYWEQAKGVLLIVVTFGTLVAIHEWGHFIAAKSVGVTVYEFALGFGPRLWTYMRRGGTDYTVRALPIGGFVNPKGMQPDDPITSDGINGRRPAERALVYLSGPLMNIILAVLILCSVGFLVGTGNDKQVLVGDVKRKSSVKDSNSPSPASQMTIISQDGQPYSGKEHGLRIGDEIVAVNGTPVLQAKTVVDVIHTSVGKQITLTVRRKGHTLELTGTPERTALEDDWATVTQAPTAPGAPPLLPGDQIDEIDGKNLSELAAAAKKGEDKQAAVVQRVLQERAGQPVTLTVWRNGETRMVLSGTAGPVELVPAGKQTTRYFGTFGFVPVPGQGPRVGLGKSIELGWENLRLIAQGFVSLFVHYKTIGNNVGGSIEIGAYIWNAKELPPFQFFFLLAQLSVSLAVFNLLPIPVLDGGHMLILFVEVLRRRRLEPEMQRAVAVVGLVIIGALVIAINFRDWLKHFG